MESPTTIESLNRALGGKYRLERELGAGGMATVYLAVDTRHERRVALKVLREDLAASLGSERFHREITIAATLQHPHIVPLYDSGESGGRLYYVMPFVEGDSLRSRLHRERELPIADAVRILRDIADALSAAHRHGVVHRDLKPENVMLSGRHALVTDFGVAKAVSASTGRQSLTTMGVALGTPTYMAPEQATADPHVDHRADIYAFGVLAYELLTGQPPFAGPSPQAVLSAHVTQPAPPVTALRDSLPSVLASLIMRCLEKRPADRWQSAEELIPLLESVLTPSGGTAPATGVVAATQTAPSMVRRSPMLVAGAAVLILALGVAAWRIAGPSRGTASPTRVAVAWLDNRTGDASLDDLGALAADWIIEGLANFAVGELVSSTEVRELMAGDLSRSATRTRDLAQRTNAGIVVSGTYYRRGDSLEYRAEVLDVRDNNILGSVGPFRGTTNSTVPLDSLFQGVAIIVASHSTGLASVAVSRPRNLDAWRAYQTAFEVFTRSQAQALPHALHAVELDPQWLQPYGTVWAIHMNAGRRSAGDSVVAAAEAAGVRLGAYERAQLDYMKAVTRGQEEAAYRAIKRAHDIAPRQSAYLLALNAARTGRLNEALRFVAERDTTFFNREWVGWTNVQRGALHLLGRFADELNVARDIVRQRGFTLARGVAEIRALAAGGNTRAVDSLLDVVWTMPPVGNTSPANLAATAAWEYRAHGREALAAVLLQRRLEWLMQRSSDQRRAQANFIPTLAVALSEAGRHDEARAIQDSLAQAAPGNANLLGNLGLIALRQGDTAAAREVDARLAAWGDPYANGGNTVWRSRIAALFGECSRAAELLRTAFAAGVSRAVITHHYYASEGRASECPALREVLRPRE